MTPQFGFSEILVLALLAIIVVGPKDLPILMKNIGKFFSSLQSLGMNSSLLLRKWMPLMRYQKFKKKLVV